jgi:probable F420-dependent oxidoreductase
MKFGAVFPTTEIGKDPAAIRDFAQAAEGLGFSHLLTYDHVVGAIHEGRMPALTGPYTERHQFHEPFVLFSYLAGITTRLRFSTGVLILPQRQTVLVAKQAAELALLSNGRLRLGVGTGWNYVEYDVLGANFDRRGAMLEEQVHFLRKLWSAPAIDFDGTFHRIAGAGINPLPPAPIQIWMGGFRKVALERAVRIGDGFIFTFHQKSSDNARTLDGLFRKYDRDPRTFGIEYIQDFSAGPDAWHRAARTWADLGAAYFSVQTMMSDVREGAAGRFSKPGQHIQALATFMAEMKGYCGVV